MTYLNWVFCWLLLLISFFIYFSSDNYFINLLLYLELISLNIFLTFSMMEQNMNLYLLTLFLVITVCEGALGLSILVKMIRTYGNNYIYSLDLSLC